jgi:hypothetical protein
VVIGRLADGFAATCDARMRRALDGSQSALCCDTRIARPRGPYKRSDYVLSVTCLLRQETIDFDVAGEWYTTSRPASEV